MKQTLFAIFLLATSTAYAQDYFTMTKYDLMQSLKAKSPYALTYYDDDNDIIQKAGGLMFIFVFDGKRTPQTIIMVPESEDAHKRARELIFNGYYFDRKVNNMMIFISHGDPNLRCVVIEGENMLTYNFMRTDK